MGTSEMGTSEMDIELLLRPTSVERLLPHLDCVTNSAIRYYFLSANVYVCVCMCLL